MTLPDLDAALQAPLQRAPQVSTDHPQPQSLSLPPAPESEQGAVKAWQDRLPILTYLPSTPEKNPLFLETRVYQGSSGRVYPLPVIDSVATEPEMHAWDAVHLENEFLRLMILPEIGGRIHVGLDKRTGYDFFYRQNVIKPALVGLAGPWISGGVEFNWPQHHRPATFMPVEIAIERSADGSATVWCSDYDPMTRLKGMHGVCLHPGKAYVEVKVRLYNPTLETQTFLWWANMATRVHEQYQSFFPRDARFVADHAKRAITEYPLSHGRYYGVDYAARAQGGVPAAEQPTQFRPEGSYPPNDLGWYANIPVPTSYMIVGSHGDFFGGYDHARQTGTVAFADHHIAPGKKQWTWGNHDFGYAWDRNLTDADGPYVELMSGVYTDNQPDFSFLAPGETKTFSQFWYPIGDIGVPDAANLEAALRLQSTPEGVQLHVQVTDALPQAQLTLRDGQTEMGHWEADLLPDTTYTFATTGASTGGAIEATLLRRGEIVLRYAPAEIEAAEAPEVATEPPLPGAVGSSDELFLIGVHLEQYRHPTRSAEPYWAEAVRRDPGDSRSNHALGRWHMRRGEFDVAEPYLRTALQRLTSRNGNPSDGEPFYTLGLTLAYLDRTQEAYAAFFKSTWNAAWRGPGYLRVAEIDCQRGQWTKALDHLEKCLLADADNLNALNLKAVVLRRLQRSDAADRVIAHVRSLDPLDAGSRFLAAGDALSAPTDAQQQIDLAFGLLRAGLLHEALEALRSEATPRPDGGATTRLYLRADILQQLGRTDEAQAMRERAAAADPAYVFPSRVEEMLLLQRAIEAKPSDARAHFYLGNLLYDRRRYAEAIKHWERATEHEPTLPTPWRNLGFARFNVQHDSGGAAAAFRRARELAPYDARLLYEEDQLRKRIGVPVEDRLPDLREHMPLVAQRDDLNLELASLLNSAGRPAEALHLLLGRQFGPWEGGEGQVLHQFVRANVRLAQTALAQGNADAALASLQSAMTPPRSLSEARHLLMNSSLVDYWMGRACFAAGEQTKANQWWEKAASQKGDFQEMQVRSISETTYWSALALRALGREAEAGLLFEEIDRHASALEADVPRIDYFATSLPAMLLFHQDLKARQDITARFLHAQALHGLGHVEAARALLQELLVKDRSHGGALDLLATLAVDEGPLHA